MAETNFRPWAFWRRVYYGVGFSSFWFMVGVLIYFVNFYEPANCFDRVQNGGETGVDCGGACVLICKAEVIPPQVLWAKSFEITKGQYNAVAYIDNSNQIAATPELTYKFELFNKGILVAEKEGKTILPPNSAYPIFEGRIFTDGRQEVTDTKLTITSAETWLPASVGRDQFSSLSIELLGADVRPRLNVELENNDIASVSNVEVVATIFNDLGEPVTASQTFVEYMAGRSSEDIVFTWPQPIAKTVRSCIIPTDVALGIDLSGSMNNDGGNPPQPVTDALNAAARFVHSLKEKDQVAVVTFATRATTERVLSNMHGEVADAVSKLEISKAEEVGFTNTPAALLELQSVLNSELHNENARRVVVILTDGLPTAPGDENIIAEATSTAQKLKDDNIQIYAIGLGENVSKEFVREIASDEDSAYFAPSGAELQRIYETITTSLCESGPTKIDVVAKTKTNFAPIR